MLERLLLGLAWLWFINLFNFMDGIDGLAGSEAIAVALGYLALLTYAGLEDPFWRLALVIAAVGRRLSVLELASGQGLHGRRRLDPAGLSAGLADAGPGARAANGPRA